LKAFRPEEEFDEETLFHLEQRTAQYVTDGNDG